MTTGSVVRLLASVKAVVWPDGGPRHLDAFRFVIDTGFTGHLAMSPELIELAGLEFSHQVRVDLADCSSVLVDVHAGLIEWQGYTVEVEVIAMGAYPILGTGLLAGWELRAQFIEGGLVTIDAISPNVAPSPAS